MECNLSFLKHPHQLTRPTSFPNKPCAASSTFSAETTKLAALWFAVEPWELYFIIRHSLAYRENCLEYLKLSIVEVHFISMPASAGDIEHGLCIKMLYRRGGNTWIRWLQWQKNPIHLRHSTFLFRFNHSFFHLCKGGSQCWLILRIMSEIFWEYSLKHAAKYTWLRFPDSNGKVIFIKAIFAEDIQILIYRAGQVILVSRVSLHLLRWHLSKDPDNPGKLTRLICSFKDRNHLNTQVRSSWR